MLCMSLLETDQLSNLSEAVELLTSLEKHRSSTLPAIYYALSKAHQKHYRYILASTFDLHLDKFCIKFLNLFSTLR